MESIFGKNIWKLQKDIPSSVYKLSKIFQEPATWTKAFNTKNCFEKTKCNIIVYYH